MNAKKLIAIAAVLSVCVLAYFAVPHTPQAFAADEHDHSHGTNDAHVHEVDDAHSHAADDSHEHTTDAHDHEADAAHTQASDDAHTHAADDAHAHDHADIVHLTDQAAEKHQVLYGPPAPAHLNIEVALNGEITLNQDNVAHVVPAVSGVVSEVRRKIGDIVHKGEVLAVIESRELADLKADYLAAVERYSMADVAFNREEKLWKDKISSEQDYLEKKQLLTEARIVKRTAEQKLYAIGFDPSYLEKLRNEPQQLLTKFELKAPFDSTILEKHATLGEWFTGEQVVFIVADLSTVWADFQVYAKDVSKIRTGQRVKVRSETGDQTFDCTLSYVSPVIDPHTRTCLARAVVPNPSGQLRPGRFIRGLVSLGDVSAGIVVSKDAVQYIDDQPCVFVKTPEGYEKRFVTLGRSTKDQVEILDGLTADDTVVTQNAFLIKSESEKSGDPHAGHAH